jgi:ribose/xylose/arabinose/galactoside ABC-type transport system permease subunit
VFALATDGFLETDNLRSVASSMSYVGLIGVGMTLIVLSGNLLSFTLGVTASASTLLMLTTLRYGVPVALVITIGFAAAVTAVQGTFIGWLRANPIIVTIAMHSMIVGVALQVTGGERIAQSGGGVGWMAGQPGGIPAETIFFLAVAAVVQVVLSTTRFGRHVFLTGANADAARVAGLPTWRTVTAVYAVAGACAGLVGVLLAARFGSTGFVQSAAGGIQYDFDAIAAVLIGGTAMAGGRGSVTRTVLGVAFVACLTDVLLLRGFSTEAQILVKGLVVLAVVLLAALDRRGRA